MEIISNFLYFGFCFGCHASPQSPRGSLLALSDLPTTCIRSQRSCWSRLVPIGSVPTGSVPTGPNRSQMVNPLNPTNCSCPNEIIVIISTTGNYGNYRSNFTIFLHCATLAQVLCDWRHLDVMKPALHPNSTSDFPPSPDRHHDIPSLCAFASALGLPNVSVSLPRLQTMPMFRIQRRGLVHVDV